MMSGRRIFASDPQWYLNNNPIQVSHSLEILGVTFGEKSVDDHCRKRLDKCRRSFYSMKDSGLSYPGTASDVKAYMWRTMCQPILLYGFDCIAPNVSNLKSVESTQGNLLKKCLGLDKRSLSSPLLQALKVHKITDCITFSNASLLNRIMKVESPVNRLNAYLLSLYTLQNVLIPNTLIHRIITFGLSPTKCMFTRLNSKLFLSNSGTVDSLRYLLMHSNFIKPYSEEHILSYLLLRSF